METIADYVMSFSIFLFAPALLPALLTRNKPHRWTCLMTAILLSAIAWGFYAKEDMLQFWAEMLGAGAWWMLLFQSRK